MNTEKLVQSRLDEIISTINIQAESLNGIAGHLREHADRMYGPAPVESEIADGQCFPGTGLGHLDQALANLKEASGRVAYEAGRNTTFA